MNRCAILLPAAGASSRMRGGDKLLEQVAKKPVLREMVQRALDTSTLLAVTLRPDDPARHAALDGLPVQRIMIPDAPEGMAASLRAGALWAASTEATALMIVLPDMPGITVEDLHSMIAAHALTPDTPLRASSADGTPGHPVILPRTFWGRMAHLRGDEGARQLFATHPPVLHRLEDARATQDLDTPEAWADWRSENPEA
jgi:molybdenum cofactor cytidylyltransferase